jgi:DNA-binding protein H-NS
MPKVKSVVAVKLRLEKALSKVAEQEAVIELIKQAVKMYELEPTDVFSEECLSGAKVAVPVSGSIPYSDRAGNTWSGKGRRPTWLVKAINEGHALEDFRNPDYKG